MTPAAFLHAESAEAPQALMTDVCVIGAGAAGAYLAYELSGAGIDVVVLEAGEAAGQSVEEAGFGFESIGDHYGGVIEGRRLGLGGSTQRWGGLLAPHGGQDLRPTDPASAIWAHITANAAVHHDAVLTALGYRAGDDFAAAAPRVLGEAYHGLRDAGIGCLAALLIPFRSKNMTHFLERAQRTANPPRVLTGAAAARWTLADHARDTQVRSVTAVTAQGCTLEIQAQRFVIAAGGLESARILLELNAAAQERALRRGAKIGLGLGDHLSFTAAVFANSSADEAARRFAPRFMGDWIRSVRFFDSAPGPDAPRWFAHPQFDIQSVGFALIREVMQAVQQRRLPQLSSQKALQGAKDILHLALSRVFLQRLYVPPSARASLQLDVEQAPQDENRISLGGQTDRFGRPALRVDWRITSADHAAMAQAATRLLSLWPKNHPAIPHATPAAAGDGFGKAHDAFHPTGACRMGDGPDAVVDRDLKVWGCNNLFVASTAVLPSAGTANPTFTLLCLTRRLALLLAGKVSRAAVAPAPALTP